MEPHPHMLAIFHVSASGRDRLVPEDVLQPLRDKYSVRISFDDPWVTSPCPFLFDALPDIQKYGQVCENLSVGPLYQLREVHNHSPARVKLCIFIAEHDPVIASKYESVCFLLGFQQLEVFCLFFTTIVRHEGEAKKRGPI